MKTKITIADVANAAGVSAATVSRVLNNKGKVKQSTKENIYTIAHELGYITPSRDRIMGKRNIFMLAPQLSNPFYFKIFEGAQDAAYKTGYRLLISQPPKDSMAMKDFLLGLVASNEFAGLILLQTIPFEVAAHYKQVNLPFVQCGEYTDIYDSSYVSIDDTLSAKNATEYLISIGRTKIALINSTPAFKYARQREKGFLAAMEQAGLAVNDNWLFHLPEVSLEAAFFSISQLLQRSERPNAIFAVSDIYAAAAIKAATRIGLRVPQDIAVLGFDDIDLAAMIEPALTTVHQPKYQLGSLACKILIDQINNPNPVPQKILLDTHLIVRESS